MPMYEYECADHGIFEKIKKISERFSCACPTCGDECEQRLTIPAAVQGGYMDKSMSLTKSSSRKN